jgi:hypothetical protein
VVATAVGSARASASASDARASSDTMQLVLTGGTLLLMATYILLVSVVSTWRCFCPPHPPPLLPPSPPSLPPSPVSPFLPLPLTHTLTPPPDHPLHHTLTTTTRCTTHSPPPPVAPHTHHHHPLHITGGNATTEDRCLRQWKRVLVDPCLKAWRGGGYGAERKCATGFKRVSLGTIRRRKGGGGIGRTCLKREAQPPQVQNQ